MNIFQDKSQGNHTMIDIFSKSNVSEHIYIVHSHNESQTLCILKWRLWQNPVPPPLTP